MKKLITISTVISILVLLAGAYALFAASGLENANTTIGKSEVVGAYCFFGSIMIVGSILNIIMVRMALNKSAVQEQS
jgi:hypothetical protein